MRLRGALGALTMGYPICSADAGNSSNVSFGVGVSSAIADNPPGAVNSAAHRSLPSRRLILSACGNSGVSGGIIAQAHPGREAPHRRPELARDASALKPGNCCSLGQIHRVLVTLPAYQGIQLRFCRPGDRLIQEEPRFVQNMAAMPPSDKRTEESSGFPERHLAVAVP